jgi:hypothetical protein
MHLSQLSSTEFTSREPSSSPISFQISELLSFLYRRWFFFLKGRIGPADSQLTMLLNTTQAAGLPDAEGAASSKMLVGAKNPVMKTSDNKTYIGIKDVPPSEVVVLTNHPEKKKDRFIWTIREASSHSSLH